MDNDIREDQKQREEEKEPGDAMWNILVIESTKSQFHRSGMGMELKIKREKNYFMKIAM